MVNELCEPGTAVASAKALAARITANAPLAVRESLAMIDATADVDDATGIRMSGEAMMRLAATEDFMEGPLAFIEKRDPVWNGR